MSQETREPGVWNGWYWRYGLLSVAGIAVLELVLWYGLHWSIYGNTLLGLLILVYLVAVRAKERTLANTLVSVVVLFVIDILLQLFVEHTPMEKGFTWKDYVGYNALSLAIAVIWSYLYLRFLAWSERKRQEVEARRRAEAAPERPRIRHHRKKKKKRRR